MFNCNCAFVSVSCSPIDDTVSGITTLFVSSTIVPVTFVVISVADLTILFSIFPIVFVFVTLTLPIFCGSVVVIVIPEIPAA